MKKQFKYDFPFLAQEKNNNPLIYLDSAATTPKPQVVIDAVTKNYTYLTAPIHRGIYETAEKATEFYENTREKVAQFFNVKSKKEIVFTSGTTDSLNMVAYGFAEHFLKKGDEIIISELEHHANIIPWQHIVKKTGTILKYIPVLENGDLDYDYFEKIISKKTKLVSVTHASNSIGTLVDIKKIIDISHAVGAYVCIDAAQSAGHIPINVQNLDIDFLACSSHKMYGPYGVGILYVKEKLHDQFYPVRLGGGAVSLVEHQKTNFLNFPQKLEAGTPAICEVIAFSTAIDYIQTNFKEIISHETEVFKYAEEELRKINHISIIGNSKKSHVLSFMVKNYHAHDIAAYLDQKNIAVRAGNHCAQIIAQKLNYNASVRISIGCYTEKSDIDRLLERVVEIK